MAEAARCPDRDQCSLQSRFAMACLAELWRVRYCREPAGFERCERRVRRARGLPVPANLLPDGELLAPER